LSPSTLCFPNTIDWYQLVPAYDADGSLVPESFPSSPTLAGIPCSCQLEMVELLIEEQQRVVALFIGWIEFGSDLGIKTRDKLIWAGAVRTHTLFVKNVTDGAGRGAVFGAQVEEAV
jgi:hypothetical protein